MTKSKRWAELVNVLHRNGLTEKDVADCICGVALVSYSVGYFMADDKRQKEVRKKEKDHVAQLLSIVDSKKD